MRLKRLNDRFFGMFSGYPWYMVRPDLHVVVGAVDEPWGHEAIRLMPRIMMFAFWQQFLGGAAADRWTPKQTMKAQGTVLQPALFCLSQMVDLFI